MDKNLGLALWCTYTAYVRRVLLISDSFESNLGSFAVLWKKSNVKSTAPIVFIQFQPNFIVRMLVMRESVSRAICQNLKIVLHCEFVVNTSISATILTRFKISFRDTYWLPSCHFETLTHDKSWNLKLGFLIFTDTCILFIYFQVRCWIFGKPISNCYVIKLSWEILLI